MLLHQLVGHCVVSRMAVGMPKKWVIFVPLYHGPQAVRGEVGVP